MKCFALTSFSGAIRVDFYDSLRASPQRLKILVTVGNTVGLGRRHGSASRKIAEKCRQTAHFGVCVAGRSRFLSFCRQRKSLKRWIHILHLEGARNILVEFQ